MTQEQQQAKTGFMESKYGKMLLVILAALLVFGGPYLVYVLVDVVGFNYYVSVASGFIVFAIGLYFVWYLIKKKVIS